MSSHLLINRKCRKWPEVEAFILEMIQGTLDRLTPQELQGLTPDTVEMGITLACDRRVRRYNRRYRGKDKPTNILSFAMNDGEAAHQTMVGDLLLAYETIQRQAKHQTKTFDAHLAHLLVHGILHLFGYDHARSKKERLRQESREIAILAELGYGNPYII